MKKTKNLALISLILGIAGCLTGVVMVGALFGIAAIVLGIMASGNSKNEKNKRWSQIGIITGAVAIAYTAVLYAWIGLHPAVIKKEPLLPQSTISGAQQGGGTESTAPVVTVTPTVKPTNVPTKAPTKAPTKVPTKVPTERPTQVPTEKPTAKPTERPTRVPTEKPTEVPTETPVQEQGKTSTESPSQKTETPAKTPDIEEEEHKDTQNTGNPATDSGKTESGKSGTDSGKTESGKSGTDSGKTDSGKSGTDSGKTDSGKSGTDSGKTDSGKSGTGSGKTDSGKSGTDSGKTDSGKSGADSGKTDSGKSGTGSGKTDSGKSGTDSGKTDSGKSGTDSGKTDSDKNGTGTESKPEAKALLTIHFLDVGQGSSALIESDGHYMLIDGGGRDASSFTVSYLAQLGIEKLDYMVATHFDEDHIAGLIGVFHKFAVGTVLEPAYKTETGIYTSFKEAEKQRGAEVVIPEPGAEYTLGDAEFTVLAPKKPENDASDEVLTDGSMQNNQSICILLKNGDNKVLFTGDAEKEEEQYLVESGRDIRADVYVIGHHGSSTSSSELLLDAVKPEYGVISCGTGNDYGHPTQEVLDRLWDKDVSVFRTDEQGNIIMTSDGKKITWSTSPSETWAPGVIPAAAPDRSGDTESVENTDTDTAGNTEASENFYVLNNNSMKFHYPGCASVQKISPNNYGESSLSRDELIAQGYSPCGNCNP